MAGEGEGRLEGLVLTVTNDEHINLHFSAVNESVRIY